MRFLKKYYIVYIFAIAMTTVLALSVSRMITSQAVPVSASDRHTVVVIDPGHGGEDGGAVSCTGVNESQLNLEISLRLRDLCNLLGVETVMVRTEDVAIYSSGAATISEKKISDLKNRVELINSTPGAVLVSVHQNTFSDSKYSGAQVFFAATTGSEDFAKSLQSTINTKLDTENHREAKPSTAVYLMKEIKCTGILVECGFLSNPAEELQLRSPEYQKKLTCAIASEVSKQVTQENGENEV